MTPVVIRGNVDSGGKTKNSIRHANTVITVATVNSAPLLAWCLTNNESFEYLFNTRNPNGIYAIYPSLRLRRKSGSDALLCLRLRIDWLQSLQTLPSSESSQSFPQYLQTADGELLIISIREMPHSCKLSEESPQCQRQPRLPPIREPLQ